MTISFLANQSCSLTIPFVTFLRAFDKRKNLSLLAPEKKRHLFNAILIII